MTENVQVVWPDDRIPNQSDDEDGTIERGPATDGNGHVRNFLPPITDGQFLEAELAAILSPEKVRGEDTTTAMFLTTPLLLSMLDRAALDNLDLIVSRDVRSQLHPGHRHQLTNARRIFQPGRGTWVRGLLRLALRDDPSSTRPYCVWADFNETNVATLIRTAEEIAARQSTHTYRPKLDPRVPHWQGAVSYQPVITRAREIVNQLALPGSGSRRLPPRGVMAVAESTLMSEAHVLRVESEQVAVLPEWESPEEVFDYADEAVLPFEPLYLDFEAPGGAPPIAFESPFGLVPISGALIFRDSGHGDLVVAPVGWPPSGIGAGGGDSTRPAGTTYGWTRYETLGWCVFGRSFDSVASGLEGEEVFKVGWRELAMEGYPQFSAQTVIVDAEEAASIDPDKPPQISGHVILPIDLKAVADMHDIAKRRDDIDADEWTAMHLSMWAQFVYELAAKTLAALSITEASEVVIADAPMEKRDRKRAEKRGWPIAQQVYIRPSRRYLERGKPSGEETHYSHQFWVRATTAHYPIGTKVADARPDLVTGCGRCGMCRKVRRPAHIKGPEGTPLVLKTLVRRKT